MRKIQQISMDKEIESDSGDTFLVKPFINTIENRDFLLKLGVMNVITGLTGQGKTYHTANSFIPKLFKEGVQIVHYTFPNLDVFDENMFQSAAADNNYIIVKTLEEALKCLKKNNTSKVVLCASNQLMYVGKNSKKYLKRLLKSKKTFGFICDEIHTWMVSSIETYNITNGTPASRFYKASMYKSLSELSQKTPYMFGITATPNMEQFGEVTPLGMMKFSIINTLPPKEMMMFKSAWVKPTLFMELNEDNLDIYLQRVMEDVKDDENKTGNKKSVLIHCTNSIGKFPVDKVMSRMMEINRLNEFWDNDKDMFVSMTGKEKYYRNSKKNGSKIKYKEDSDAKRWMNDQNDEARFMFIIEKGKCGMNIPNLKFMVSLRDTEKVNKNGYRVVHTNKQVMGRMVRINSGNVKLDTYGLEKGFLDGQLDKDQMLIDNSIQFYVPNTPSWVIAVQEFEKNYVNTIEEAGRKIDELMRKVG